MYIFRMSFLDCTARLSLPAILLLLLTALVTSTLDTLDGVAVDSTGMWLHLPAMLLSAVAIAAVLDGWPLFGRDRQGAALLERLPTGPLDGCGSASAGGIAALGLFLGAAGALFGAWTSDRTQVERRITLDADGQRALARAGDELRLLLSEPTEIRAVKLRPRAFYPPGGVFEPVALEVALDGEVITGEPRAVLGLGQPLDLRFTPRVVSEIVLRSIGDAGPRLTLPDGSAVVFRTGRGSAVVNAILASLSYLYPAGLALLLACLLRRHVMLGVAIVLALAALLLATLTGFTPNGDAVHSYARGLWILDQGTLGVGFPSLSGTVVVMLLAVWVGRR